MERSCSSTFWGELFLFDATLLVRSTFQAGELYTKDEEVSSDPERVMRPTRMYEDNLAAVTFVIEPT